MEVHVGVKDWFHTWIDKPNLWVSNRFISSKNGKNTTILWILDIEATYHVTHTTSQFINYYKIKPITVQLPNGLQVVANYFGIVVFKNTYTYI